MGFQNARRYLPGELAEALVAAAGTIESTNEKAHFLTNLLNAAAREIEKCHERLLEYLCSKGTSAQDKTATEGKRQDTKKDELKEFDPAYIDIKQLCCYCKELAGRDTYEFCVCGHPKSSHWKKYDGACTGHQACCRCKKFEWDCKSGPSRVANLTAGGYTGDPIPAPLNAHHDEHRDLILELTAVAKTLKEIRGESYLCLLAGRASTVISRLCALLDKPRIERARAASKDIKPETTQSA